MLIYSVALYENFGRTRWVIEMRRPIDSLPRISWMTDTLPVVIFVAEIEKWHYFEDTLMTDIMAICYKVNSTYGVAP